MSRTKNQTLTPATAPRTPAQRTRTANGTFAKKTHIAAVAPVEDVAAAIAHVVETQTPEQQHTDVRQRAMLVKLTIHKWLAKVTDENITSDVHQRHNIASEMGSYKKQLLPKEALEKLRSACRKLRRTHNGLTLPWDEAATRILSARAFMEYNKVIRAGIAELDQIFEDELAAPGESGKSKYDEAVDRARVLLNGAFRASDYPTLDKLRKRFSAEITIMPIPAAEDFRLDLGRDATAQVRRELEANVTDRIEEAMSELRESVYDVVAKFASALHSDDASNIRATLFTSIERICDKLPLLNFVNDSKLVKIESELRDLLQTADARALRDVPALRDAATKRADEILAQMSDFI